MTPEFFVLLALMSAIVATTICVATCRRRVEFWKNEHQKVHSRLMQLHEGQLARLARRRKNRNL